MDSLGVFFTKKSVFAQNKVKRISSHLSSEILFKILMSKHVVEILDSKFKNVQLFVISVRYVLVQQYKSLM